MSMKTFDDLEKARAEQDEYGGWLLDIGYGDYLVTEDEGIVHDLRGPAYVARSEALQCWDETLLPALSDEELWPRGEDTTP